MGRKLADTVDSVGGSRRFACTSCGMCCDRGPELELGEATLLADKLIMSVLLRVHSLPLHENSRRAAQWWQRQGSSRPVQESLAETRHHLSHFSAQDIIDMARGRSLHLEISALSFDTVKGRCPALVDNLCSIYASRPLACRTVPLHYSLPPSTLVSNLDRFVRTPGYQCRTTPDAPVILEDGSIADASMQRTRDDALNRAASDRVWKETLAKLMDDADTAVAAGLPSYEMVLRHSDTGTAMQVSMLIAWRIATRLGVISTGTFRKICKQQVILIKAELARGPDDRLATDLLDMRHDYEAELSRPPEALWGRDAGDVRDRRA